MEVSRICRTAAVFVNKRRAFAAIILALVLGTAFAVPQATAQDSLGFDIPGLELNTALLIFADRAGLQLVYDAGFVKGLRSTPLKGAYTPEDGLTRLLEGTGIGFRFTGPDKVSLKRVLVKKPSGPKVPVKAPAQPDPPKKIKVQAKPTKAQAKTGDRTQAPLIVTGELLQRSRQDSQASVAVIHGDELERRAKENLYDMAERTANLTSEHLFGRFTIRGITSPGFGGGGGALISTRIDGAAFDNSRLAGRSLESSWDLEQIEVLRGPQSTQAGRNALAGAIEIRSKDPVYEDEAKIRMELGNASTFGGAFAVNLPVVEDTLALRLSFDFDKTDGFVDNPIMGIDDYAREKQSTLRTGVRLDPTDDLSAILKYTRVRSSGQLDGPSVDRAAFPGRRVLSRPSLSEEEGDLDSGNLRLGYDISDAFRLESETTYFEGDIFADLSPNRLTQDQQSFEQEIKLLYRTDRAQAVLGGFYAQQESSSALLFSGLATMFGGPATETIFLNRVNANDATNYAAFAEVEYRVLPQIRLIAGGRYDRESRDNQDQTLWSSTDPTVTLPASGSTQGDTSFDAWLPKVGVVYDFTGDLSLGFTVQRGYRAGGSGFNLFTTEEFDIDPEFTWNYEVSFRSQWLDNRLTLNANLFYTDWTDQQVRVRGPSGEDLDFTVENAGESRLFGGEIEVEAKLTRNLEFFFSVGYADTEFEDFISGGEQLAGNEFPFASKFTGALGGTYYFLDGFFFSADVSFQDDTFSDVQNTDENVVNSRFLANARLGYETDSWSVLAYVDNILDKDYVVNVRSATELIVGDPLTFGLIGQIRF